MSEAELDAAIRGLEVDLEGLPPAVRSLAAARTARDLLERHRSRASSEAIPVEDAVRTLVAQRDMLALVTAEHHEKTRADARDRELRLRGDREVLAAVRSFFPIYSTLALVALAGAPLLAFTAGSWVLVATVPAIAGFAEMRRRKQSMDGRLWVALRSDVDAVAGRARLWDIVAASAIALSFVLFAVVGGPAP